MTPREVEEYRSLRDTIRERGTARHWIVVAGFATWALLAVTIVGLAAAPVITLLPLLLLEAVFEVVFAIHTGVERVGRYLQVFFEGNEDEEVARWEHVAMAYGRSFPGGGIDALFSPIFCVAALLNFVPVMLSGPVAIDWAIVGAVHVLFIARVWSARNQAGRQRAVDLERFTKLRDDMQRAPLAR
jgi:hypothetical protein